MSHEWKPVEIVSDLEVGDEPLGTKQKFWVENPDDQSLWLFKLARVTGGRTLGEDWAEWIVHHVGAALATPTAQILPSRFEGRRGIVSKTVVDFDAGQRLVHRNSLLAETDANYDATLKRENPRYTVAAVHAALLGVSAPADFAGEPALTGFDVWAGYLVLDALVAGRDRHHENWGVLSAPSSRALAPSYDHGNALGFQEREEHLVALSADSGLRANWLARGRSHHFAGRPGLVDLAHEALLAASQPARVYWKERLRSLSTAQLRDIVNSVPRDTMSEPASTFALEILTENRERLFRDYPDH